MYNTPTALRTRPPFAAGGAQGTIIAHLHNSDRAREPPTCLKRAFTPFTRSSGDLYSLTTRKVHINVPILHVKKTSVWEGGLRVGRERGITKKHEDEKKETCRASMTTKPQLRKNDYKIVRQSNVLRT